MFDGVDVDVNARAVERNKGSGNEFVAEGCEGWAGVQLERMKVLKVWGRRRLEM